MNYQLSICIPTYNREKYLKQLLDCILKQLTDIEKGIVEICVSDNASTDNTQSMIQKYQQQYSNLTYFRWDKNMGADMNYLKVVEIAHGKYCWFFGSDDLMVDGAIKKILEEIKENHDIYLCNRIECDMNMVSIREKSFFKYKDNSKIFQFNNNNDIYDYFESINALGGVFSYLSSIIFKKKQWDSIKFDNNFIGTAYAHCYILLSLLKNNITLKYLNEYIVMNRNGNDSFLINGIIKRMKIDFDGYKKLFITIFENNKKLANCYKMILRAEHPFSVIIGQYVGINYDDKKLLLSFVTETYNVCLIKFISVFYYIYRKFIKKFLQKLNIHQKIVKFLFFK